MAFKKTHEFYQASTIAFHALLGVGIAIPMVVLIACLVLIGGDAPTAGNSNVVRKAIPVDRFPNTARPDTRVDRS